MSMPIRVLVALPSQEYCHIYFAMSLRMMTAPPDILVQVTTGRGSNVAQNRNGLVHLARKQGFDYILMIDNDMSFPANIVERLVRPAEERGLDIIGCNYLFRTPPHQVMVRTRDGAMQTLEGIDEVDCLPAGMLLIRTSALDKLKQPYFLYRAVPSRDAISGEEFVTAGTEDYYFCEEARAAGLKVWMESNLSLHVIHWMGSIGVVWRPHSDPAYEYVMSPPNMPVAAPEAPAKAA